MKQKIITTYTYQIPIVILITIVILLQNNIYSQQKQGASDQEKPKEKTTEPIKENKPWEREVTGWRIKDYKPYIQAMKDLENLSKEHNDNLLKLALDEYSTGIDILEDMENEILKLLEKNKNKKNLAEMWYWQEIDRKDRERKQIARKKYNAKRKSVTFFVKAIKNLDNIQLFKIQKDPKFINFKAKLFQVYVSCQYDLYNYKSCIPILERYIELNKKTREDVWAYKYLSNCCAYMEALLSKYKHSTEKQIWEYKQKKNKFMLHAAKENFGVDSIQYKHLLELVERDEKKNKFLNDFQ